MQEREQERQQDRPTVVDHSEAAVPGEPIDAGEPTPVHPFADRSRRCDVRFFPTPVIAGEYKRAAIYAVEEGALEFSDEKGNHYRMSGIPYIVVSFSPEFDPETEGRLIRNASGGLA